MTREEVAKAVGEIANSGLSAEDLASVLKSSAHPVYQVVFNSGHDVGYGKKNDEVREAEKTAEAAKARAEKAEKRLKELEASQPDVAEIRKQYQAEIEELKEGHKGEIEAERQRATDAMLRRARSDLVNALVAEGVDPDFAAVVVERDEQKDRIGVDPETHEIVVMQKGKQIPIQAADGDSPLKLFAAEIRQGVKSKWLTSNADAGSGQQGGGGSSTSGKSFYDSIREEVKGEREKTKPQGREALDRMARGAPAHK